MHRLILGLLAALFLMPAISTAQRRVIVVMVDGYRWQELFYVTLPQMGPQLMFGAVMQISTAFAVGSVNQALTGFPSSNYSTHTLLLHMLDYGTVRFEMGYSSAIAVVLFILMMASWLLVNKVLKKYSEN